MEFKERCGLFYVVTFQGWVQVYYPRLVGRGAALTDLAHSRPRALVCSAGAIPFLTRSWLLVPSRGCSTPGSSVQRSRLTIVLRRIVGTDLCVERPTIAKRLPRLRSKSCVFSSDAKRPTTWFPRLASRVHSRLWQPPPLPHYGSQRFCTRYGASRRKKKLTLRVWS